MHTESHPANGYATPTPVHRVVVAVDGSDAAWQAAE